MSKSARSRLSVPMPESKAAGAGMRHFFPSTESPLAMIESRLRAHEVVLQCLVKAVALMDTRSAHAIAHSIPAAIIQPSICQDQMMELIV